MLLIHKLKQLLNNSKISHKNEILKKKNLKDVHLYCKINNLSGQLSGPLIESFIKQKYSMKKNNPSSCSGDLNKNNQNFEIKASNGGKDHNKFNYVQLRMNHNCIYLFTAFYLNHNNLNKFGELFIFKIDKNAMKNLIFQFGAYAHGTKAKLGNITLKDLNDPNNDKEYSLRTKFGDSCWNELLKYRISESSL